MDTFITIDHEDYDPKRPTIDLGNAKLTPEDAVKCLIGKYNVIIPTPNARPCNNLDEYFHKSTINLRKTPKNNGVQSSASTSMAANTPTELRQPFSVPLVRNFERILRRPTLSADGSPSMLPTRPKRPRHDLFTKIDQIETKSGPISHLKDRLNQKVRVLVRRRRKVPYISRVIEYRGTLSMFDKHMNMYLKDVIEFLDYKRDDSKMKRSRFRDGIILRGDNVILVS